MILITYVCMYVFIKLHITCMYVSIYLSIYVSMYLCIYVSMYLCIYVSMYVCMYVCIFIKLHIITAHSGPVILVILCHSH